MGKGPVIRKSTSGRRANKLRGLIGKFVMDLDPVIDSMVGPGGLLEKLDWENPSDENLLKLRQSLANEIKTGMLERKNREQEIAVLAALVWFMRLDRDKQERILGWG